MDDPKILKRRWWMTANSEGVAIFQLVVWVLLFVSLTWQVWSRRLEQFSLMTVLGWFAVLGTGLGAIAAVATIVRLRRQRALKRDAD